MKLELGLLAGQRGHHALLLLMRRQGGVRDKSPNLSFLRIRILTVTNPNFESQSSQKKSKVFNCLEREF